MLWFEWEAYGLGVQGFGHSVAMESGRVHSSQGLKGFAVQGRGSPGVHVNTEPRRIARTLHGPLNRGKRSQIMGISGPIERRWRFQVDLGFEDLGVSENWGP